MMRPRCYQRYADDHIRRMHREIEVATRRLEFEKRQLSKLDHEIQRTRLDLDTLKYSAKHALKHVLNRENTSQARPNTAPRAGSRTPRLTPRPLTARSGPGVRKIVIEARLDTSMKQLNKLRSTNATLVQSIDDKRTSQLQLNNVWKKLQEDMRIKQREINNINNSVVEAKEVLNDAEQRKEAIKKILSKERKSVQSDIVRMRMEMKGKEHEKKEYEIKVNREQKQGIKKHLVTEEEKYFNQEFFMRKIFKTGFLNAIQRRNVKQHVKSIEVFEQAFATIKSTTGVSDIKEIVNIFVKLEERNFSLLSYCNQISQEIENISGCNKNFVQEEEIRANFHEAFQMQRKDAVTNLIDELELTNRNLEMVENAHNAHRAILGEITPYMVLTDKVLSSIDAPGETTICQKPLGQISEKTTLEWLHYFERIFLLYRDYMPHTLADCQPFPYTVGPSVKTNLAPKKTHAQGNFGLLRAGELPSYERYDEDDDDHVLSIEEVKHRVAGQIARQPKKKGMFHVEQPIVVEKGHSIHPLVAYQEIIRPPTIESSNDLEQLEDDIELEGIEPNDEELNKIFLSRYKMSRTELKGMAVKMGIQLSNLCYLKQEFDTYDLNQSGYIDLMELNQLLQTLGENLTEAELHQAFKQLDSDKSGEIEFFEFVQWFTSED